MNKTLWANKSKAFLSAHPASPVCLATMPCLLHLFLFFYAGYKKDQQSKNGSEGLAKSRLVCLRHSDVSCPMHLSADGCVLLAPLATKPMPDSQPSSAGGFLHRRRHFLIHYTEIRPLLRGRTVSGIRTENFVSTGCCTIL